MWVWVWVGSPVPQLCQIVGAVRGTLPPAVNGPTPKTLQALSLTRLALDTTTVMTPHLRTLEQLTALQQVVQMGVHACCGGAVVSSDGRTNVDGAPIAPAAASMALRVLQRVLPACDAATSVPPTLVDSLCDIVCAPLVSQCQAGADGSVGCHSSPAPLSSVQPPPTVQAPLRESTFQWQACDIEGTPVVADAVAAVLDGWLYVLGGVSRSGFLVSAVYGVDLIASRPWQKCATASGEVHPHTVLPIACATAVVAPRPGVHLTSGGAAVSGMVVFGGKTTQGRRTVVSDTMFVLTPQPGRPTELDAAVVHPAAGPVPEVWLCLVLVDASRTYD